jgi:hypothetical protein
MFKTVAACVTICASIVAATPMQAADRHTGYYYPAPGAIETYKARTIVIADADRKMRLGFIVGITQNMLSQPYAPRFVIYAKGDDAEKMIIVALEDDFIDTLYRARALLAQLTAISRTTPLLQELGLADFLTFFDLVKLLGFVQITISDGDEFTHQILLE